MASKNTPAPEAPEIDAFDPAADADPFSAPAPSDFFKCKDHENELVIVDVESYETGVSTVHGESDAVRATVHVLSGDDAPTTYEGTLIFGKVIVPQLKRQVGKKVLGRVVMGENKKPGQNAPWMIEDATKDDDARRVATAFLADLKRKADPFS